MKEVEVLYNTFLLTVENKSIRDTIEDLGVSDKVVLINILDYIAFGDIDVDPSDWFRHIHNEMPSDNDITLSEQELVDILWSRTRLIYDSLYHDIRYMLSKHPGFVGHICDATIINNRHIFVEIEYVER